MTITAKFPGRCWRCGGRINPGERIEWLKQAGYSYTYHARCWAAEEAERQRAAEAARLVGQPWSTSLEGEGLAEPPICAECGERIAPGVPGDPRRLRCYIRRLPDGTREYRHDRCAQLALLRAGRTIRLVVGGDRPLVGQRIHYEHLGIELEIVGFAYLPTEQRSGDERWEVECKLPMEVRV